MGDADLGHGSIPGGENGSGEGRRGKAQEVLKGRAEMMLCPEVQHTKSPGALERGGLCSELQKPGFIRAGDGGKQEATLPETLG